METESIIARAERLALLFEDSVRDDFEYVSNRNDFALAAQALRACIEGADEENWAQCDGQYKDTFLPNGGDGPEFFQRALTVKE